MKTMIFLISFMLPIVSFCQVLIYPKIPTDRINGLHFIDENEVIFINDGGSIFKSYNGGVTWELKESFPEYSLDEMHFLNDRTGFIKASSGLLYTTDSGENWEYQQISLFGTSFLPVSQSRTLKSLEESGIFLLDNFFNNWTQTYFYKMFTDSGSDYILDLPYGYIKQFEQLPSGSILALGINENAFYNAVIDDSLSLILQSNDFGSSWDTLYNDFSRFIYDVSFNNDSMGWASSDTTIFKTTNGGQNWVKRCLPGLNTWIGDILAIENDKLYGVTSSFNSQFIKTDNSGDTWNLTNLNFPGYYKLSFYNDKIGFLFGTDLIETLDGGQTWSKIDTSINSDIYDVDFTSLNNGLALASNGLYKTANGGYSWSKQLELVDIVSNKPGSLKMINDSLGWLMTYNHVYKTIDGGSNWEAINFSNNEQNFNGFDFYNEHLGIIFSVSEVDSPRNFSVKHHYITKNGGESWMSIPIAPDTISRYPGYYDKMQFTDPKHLWAINQQGLWVSNDTSKTWQNDFNVDYFYGNYSFDFYNSSIGIISQSGDFLYFTNNGGDTWQTLNRGIYSSPKDIKILGPDFTGRFRVLEAGEDLIKYDIDIDGNITNSQKLNSYTSNRLNAIFVLEQNNFPYVWIAGNGFSILYRQWELIYTGIEKNQIIPYEYSLEQNYPNPFNPTTKIKFSIAKADFVKILVYNILGQKVKTLINEFRSSGTYELQFDATNLSSGIYYYQLNSGSFNKVNKMIVLK